MGFLDFLKKDDTGKIIGSLGFGAVGGLASILGARGQQGVFNKRLNQINQLLSPEAVGARFNELLRQERGFIEAGRRDSRLLAESSASAASARFRRAGLSGVGETIATGIEAGVGARAQRARDIFKLGLLKRAREDQDRKARAIAQLLGTPFGSVSAISAGVAGAGAGLEAFGNSVFAEQLSGKRVNEPVA